MSKEQSVLFFDNGFFRNLLKGKFKHHLEVPKSDLSIAIMQPYKPWRTPFAFMEWIGLDSESLPKPQPFNPATVSGTDYLVPACRYYQEFYEKVSELDHKNLEYLAATQRKYVCTEMIGIWDSAVGGIFGKADVSGWLRFALSFDAVHKLNILHNHQKSYWSDLIAKVFFNHDRRVRNLSKFRLAYRMWIWAKDRLNYPGANPEMLQCIEKAHSLIKINNWKDYLDSDLVHVATHGAEDSSETRHRVYCLTCDPPDKVVMRIRVYKGLLSYVRGIYGKKAEANGFPPDFDYSHNGKVFCFDREGNLVRKIDVTTETPAIKYII